MAKFACFLSLLMGLRSQNTCNQGNKYKIIYRKNLNSPDLSQTPPELEKFLKSPPSTKISQLSPKKILNPHPKISQPPKNMLTINPPVPPPPLYISP